jgi:hypothetical protein
MDTDKEYLSLEFYVRFSGETPPEYVEDYYESRIEDPDNNLVGYNDSPFRDYHRLNRDVPIDGVVSFYWPNRMDCDSDDNPFYISFPFRDVRTDEYPWFGKPKTEEFPVWKWTNPEKNRDEITLEPSLGVGNPLEFHCNVRNGEIEWL